MENNTLKRSFELYAFSENHFEKYHLKSIQEIAETISTDKKFWLNIYKGSDESVFKEVCDFFEIHPVALEDIQNTDQRPKLEDFDNFILIVTKMLYTKSSIEELEVEQLSIVFNKNLIITFQEHAYDIFDPIRIRLENPQGKMRKLGTDYFSYTLLDAILDQYYVILELISDQTEKLEDDIIHDQKKVHLADIYRQRKNLQEIKKIVWPTRELISSWRKSDSLFVTKKAIPFINDIYESAVEIIENLEMQRESITTLVEIFMSNISLKQNEVMKTLTIIATIFIPLTFIAGVYGMNFEYMPELGWKYGYLTSWIFFIVVSLLMVFYFKRKRWF
ncbi:magnesium/cobalt transporter CorA [Belliella kenyensis]|uniref:Magnesium transport protein CorA n=1 Tax=Belliella kenyensis TaxID=1472724 RepID=A0ABV8ES77_9BACT|nr:magnesium/cobalt transporter CorA [Belliella kenyensis]MCH7401973.1 magnesium/cobalt transporter CorA [Belliella kenyensis]MDN3605137.1 magnesium/cobalt transporter CorA [Belliella kenyensis]